MRRSGAGPALLQHLTAASPVAAPWLLGNQARLLVDGPQTQRAMFAAMAAARAHIDIETYMVDHTVAFTGGINFSAVYSSSPSASSARRGGSGAAGRSGKSAAAGAASDAARDEAVRNSGWRDTHVAVEGPIVVQFQQMLDAAWQRQKCEAQDARTVRAADSEDAGEATAKAAPDAAAKIAPDAAAKAAPAATAKAAPETRPAAAGRRAATADRATTLHPSARGLAPAQAATADRPRGQQVMRLVAADPARATSETYVALLSAIAHAQRSVWLTYGYFAPDPQTIETLQAAAHRGVDVRLVLPGISDSWAPLYAGRAHYAALLASGVRIFERHDALLHAKTAVIDGVWGSVGSTNLDWRSFVHNYEADLVVVDAEFGAALQGVAADDQSAALEITAADWKRRGVLARIKEWAAQVVAYWL
jgi:cardiolipin synthase